jgi:hypothetical protein
MIVRLAADGRAGDPSARPEVAIERGMLPAADKMTE